MGKDRSLVAKILIGIVLALMFIGGLGLVIYGQRTISYFNLGLMLIGLFLLLVLIYLYNKKFNV